MYQGLDKVLKTLETLFANFRQHIPPSHKQLSRLHKKDSVIKNQYLALGVNLFMRVTSNPPYAIFSSSKIMLNT